MQFLPLQIQKTLFKIPLFLAPMAGISHSAFRRLIAHFGGYGALFTEMVPLNPLIAENCAENPLTKRRPEEGAVVYQLVSTGSGSLELAVKKLISLDPLAIDINLGCPAPMVSYKGGGKALFDDFDRLREILDQVRTLWSGPLMVKCRLGHEKPGWEEQLLKRLELFKSIGIDALTVHPRFFHEKLKRKARWSTFTWIKSNWPLPLIGNGDMVNDKALELLHPDCCDGLMIGRGAVHKPWIFSQLCGAVEVIDYAAVWNMLDDFTREDFIEARALGRMKEFTEYFSTNFFFGHELFTVSQSAHTCMELHERVNRFLSNDPQISL